MPRVPRRPSAPNQPRTRRVSGAIDQGVTPTTARYDDQGRITGSGIRTVKSQHDQNWHRTRERAAECRALLAGEMPQVMPENFRLAQADAFAADLPSTYTRPAEMLAMNTQKTVEIKRFATTASQRAKDTSTTLEQILEATMGDAESGYPWNETCDVVQNDGLGCLITQPMMSYWEQPPDWQDPDSKTFKSRYQRDSAGKSRGENGRGFRVSGKQSKKAYEEDLEDYLANHVPVLYRCFGPQQVTPIFGPRYQLEAVIVSGQYQRTSEMVQQFLWGQDDHLSPQGTTDGSWSSGLGSYGEVEVLEYWGYDADRKPYVSYSVDGMTTFYRGDEGGPGDPAIIDLSPYCSRLPVSVKWGQHWPGAPLLDQRALPFMWPFLQSIRQANAIATGITVALWWAGFPTYVTDRSASQVPLPPGAAARTIEIEPLKLIETDGPVTRLSGGDVSKDAYQMLTLLLGETKEAMPAQQASGKGESSGFEKTIARAYAEDAQYQILEGIRQLYEEAASFTLEILTNVAREKGRPVPVYYSGPVISMPESADVSSTRARLSLTEDLAGDQWKVQAKYRPTMSLAERQQSAELVERRLKTRRRHFEDDGDPAPERTAAEIEAEDLVASDLGQQQRWALVAKILGDDQMAEKLKLMTQQKITQASGLPFALAEGFEEILARRAAAEAGANGGSTGPSPGMVPPGMPPGVPPGMAGMPPPGMEQLGAPAGGAMTGLGGPTSAQSSLAGAVGGAMQSGPINQASAAGGMIPAELGG